MKLVYAQSKLKIIYKSLYSESLSREQNSYFPLSAKTERASTKPIANAKCFAGREWYSDIWRNKVSSSSSVLDGTWPPCLLRLLAFFLYAFTTDRIVFFLRFFATPPIKDGEDNVSMPREVSPPSDEPQLSLSMTACWHAYSMAAVVTSVDDGCWKKQLTKVLSRDLEEFPDFICARANEAACCTKHLKSLLAYHVSACFLSSLESSWDTSIVLVVENRTLLVGGCSTTLVGEDENFRRLSVIDNLANAEDVLDGQHWAIATMASSLGNTLITAIVVYLISTFGFECVITLGRKIDCNKDCERTARERKYWYCSFRICGGFSSKIFWFDDACSSTENRTSNKFYCT